jgi:hypothetical protein
MKLLLVCEGDGDDDDLITLTQRVLHAAHSWMIGLESLQEPTPAWVHVGPDARFLKWADINKLCDDHRVPRVQDIGLRLGARRATRLTRLLSTNAFVSEPDGVRVLLVHDDDGEAGWREALERIREQWLRWLDDEVRLGRRAPQDIDIAIGIATPEHESWVIAAFEHRDTVDGTRLAELRQMLGFDPCLHGERLTSGREIDPKNAKRVLEHLCPDTERRRALLCTVDLDLLRSRGEAIGLREFLDELRTRVASGYGATR